MNSIQNIQAGSRKWLVLTAVGIGTFMSALDGSVVNIILPVVSKAFNTDVAAIEWVVVIYLLVVSGLLLTFGRLGDLRGHRQVYLAGFIIFILGSILCGFAPDEVFLVASRAFQALGAAMLFSNSPAILTASFPASQRGQALGLQGTMTYLGLTVGPSLGGWLAQIFSWRAVFYINVPVGILALALSWLAIPADLPQEHSERFDFPGALLFLAGLVSLLLALNEGANWGWGSPAILALLAGAAVLLGVFIRWELRRSSPMLDLSLFRSPVFTLSALSALFNYIAMHLIIFLMPFYLLTARGFTPSFAGLILTAQPLVMAVVAPISGSFSDKVGTRLPAVLGMLIMTVGLILLAQAGEQTLTWQIMAGLAICGLGIGIFVSPNNSSLMGSAPRNRQGIASGILATARNVGMVLGIGLAGAVLTTFQTQGGGTPIISALHTGLLIAAGFAVASALTSLARNKG